LISTLFRLPFSILVANPKRTWSSIVRRSDHGRAGVTTKLIPLVAVPPGVVTLSGPVVASGGTVA
jgi:hypothetical protein